ncbi:MAG: DUF1565 domain-containing protein, partial [Bacteroidales bacterium]|nr:DUF1565 domain-containing protein [Bacteroidales bacterium]
MCYRAFRYVYLVIISFLSVSANGGAKNYFVSVLSGNDESPGTRQQPFRSIRRAALLAEAEDTCFIMEGVYREEVIPAHDGDPDHPVVYCCYSDMPVIITGADKVNKWLPWKKGVWKAYVPHRVRQLLVNGKLANLARYPDK